MPTANTANTANLLLSLLMAGTAAANGDVMVERLIDRLTEYLKLSQGKIVYLRDIREFLKIEPGSKDDTNLRTQMSTTLAKNRVVYPSGKGDGAYKVVVPVKPVSVFGINRERRPPFELIFPRNFDTMMEMDFAEDVVIREGDLVLISGLSNYGKTALAMNFCGENINKNPVLMGNEYTNPQEEPLPRFLNRLDAMDINKGGWVDWIDVDGNDKFVLLPVREDYAEHVARDKINIIDWINIETGEHYMIGTILDSIKRNLGRGVGIICIQKAEGATAGRGGQFTKDFADLELLIDKLGKSEILLTIGKCKEYNKQVVGKSYGYSIYKGVKITNFREVKKCRSCYGKGYNSRGSCEECNEKGWVDA